MGDGFMWTVHILLQGLPYSVMNTWTSALNLQIQEILVNYQRDERGAVKVHTSVGSPKYGAEEALEQLEASLLASSANTNNKILNSWDKWGVEAVQESLSLKWLLETVLKYSDPLRVSWRFDCLDYYPNKNLESNFKMYWVSFFFF